MTPGRVACGMAVLAVLCVLGIFFFPVVDGPYSAVHGPVTALLSIRAAARLQMTIVRAGLSAVRSCLDVVRMALVVMSWIVFSAAEFRQSGLSAGFDTILRC